MDISNLKFRQQHLRVTSITTSIDEFYIRQRTYKISIKLELDSGPLSFNTAYSRNRNAEKNPVPLYCVRRSIDLPPCKDSKVSVPKEVPPYFSFYLELDRDTKTQNSETCTLFLKGDGSGEVERNLPLLKYAVRVICPCNSSDMDKNHDENNAKFATDFYPECNKFAMNDFNQRSCLQLGKHSHHWQKHGLAQEYLITITEFDFSEAVMIPYEAQRILAKRTLEKEVKDTNGAYFTEIKKPFDVTIICKDGMEIDVHAYVLSTRNQVFRKMLSTGKKVSGRGTSFRKLAKEAFLGLPDRNKKHKTITIDESELTSVTMKVLLHFIYFGELHKNWKINLTNILHGAQKYRLDQFLDMINGLLITVCKKNNALHLLKLAERYSLKGAESAIQDYVFTNLGGILQSSVQITSV